MHADLLEMLETMAQSGTAPETGCQLFSVGNDDAFLRLKHTYLTGQFSRGRSAEKFVIGPFGSGKTHFLRQLFEVAESCNCCFAEVYLNKDVDFTQRLVVYREIARAIRVPDSTERGIKNLLQSSLSRVRAMLGGADEAVTGWIEAIDQLGFEEVRYARQLKHALLAMVSGDIALADEQCRWLEGDVKDRNLCKLLGEQPISSAEENLFSNRAISSICQFIKHANYTGTVVGFDEAEQGFSVDKKKFHKILSMLQGSINASAGLKGAAVLMVYALTPDLVGEMEKFAALQQRVSDPSEQETFFDGNTYATKIDLTRRGAAEDDLKAIGKKLTELFYDRFADQLGVDRETLLLEISKMATEIVSTDATSSNRRTMTKRVCQKLMRLYDECIGGEREAVPVPAFSEPEV